MKIVDGSVYSKKELVEIINHILNLDYCYEKKKSLLDETHEFLKEMETLPLTEEGYMERVKISRKIDTIYQKVKKIEKSIVID